MTFETELRQVQKLEPGDVFLWKEDGATVCRTVKSVTPRALGTAILLVRVDTPFGGFHSAQMHVGGRVEVIRPVAAPLAALRATVARCIDEGAPEYVNKDVV